MPMNPDRNIGLEIMRATEAAALSAARWVGLGQKESGDGAAVDAMRMMLKSVPMDGMIVIGEGEKDNAPMLYNGEKVGSGDGPAVDVAVDPVEGTNLLAKGLPNSIAIVGLAAKGAMWDPGPAFYMDKLVVGPEAAGKVDIDAPVKDNVEAIAKAKGIKVNEVTIVLLERERNIPYVQELRRLGVRVRLISDGDVAPSLMAALPGTGIDAVMGIGGTPEGVIVACAMHGLGGEIQGRLSPQSASEMERVLAAGRDLKQKLDHHILAGGDDHFFAATGITEGSFLKGVRYTSTGAATHSLVTRSKSGTFRVVESFHNFNKLKQLSAIDY